MPAAAANAEQDGVTSRLELEIELLQSIYPEHVSFDAHAREGNFRSSEGSFTLRLPSGYLIDALPEVLSASTSAVDLRDSLRECVRTCEVGEEVLDEIVTAFLDLLQSVAQSEVQPKESQTSSIEQPDAAKATVLIWLHHLLNTNKRKLALSPPPGVSGLSKPGYPGVLLYSGPSQAVHEHVGELKQQNWAAFQVRLESDEEWRFSHGEGVREVESMKQVVVEIGERKEEFLEAMRMK